MVSLLGTEVLDTKMGKITGENKHDSLPEKRTESPPRPKKIILNSLPLLVLPGQILCCSGVKKGRK